MACNCQGNQSTDIIGSGCGCNCDQQLTPGCNSRCGCQSATPSPTPYYLQGGGCQESHDRVVVQNRHATAISTKSDAVVPACGGTTTLLVDGLISIPIGAYLWSAVIDGYLKVVSFDYVQGQVVVENDCAVNGGTPGASIPKCTLFLVTPPPSASGSVGPSSLYPFVAVDFTAPANGNCLDITVTNTNGLVVGKNVQIGSGTYRVSLIQSATIITICNDGAGVTPGTVIDSQDSSGNYIVPIILIDASPCTNPVTATGAIVTCKDGIQQPLDAQSVGQIPVVVNAETNEVQFQSIDIPTRCCTLLASCWNFISGTSTYTIFVDDNSCDFQAGDILQIENDVRTDRRFEIDTVTDPTHYIVTVTPAVTYTETIAEGTQICMASCCEQLAADIQDVYTYIQDPCTSSFLADNVIKWFNPRVCSNKLVRDFGLGGITLSNDGLGLYPVLYRTPEDDSQGWLDMTFCNPTCMTAKIAMTVSMWVKGVARSVQYGADAGKSVLAYMEPNYNYEVADCGTGEYQRAGYAGPSDIPPAVTQMYILDDTGNCAYTMSHTYTIEHFIGAGDEIKVSLRVNPKVTVEGSANDDSRIDVKETGVSVMGVMISHFNGSCS